MLTLKKSLGQHFLTDERVSQKIVEALKESPFTNLVEIDLAAGRSQNTCSTLENINFKCIEIDTEKVNYLLKTYPSLKEKIINQDILEAPKPFDEPFTVVGNFLIIFPHK